MGPTWGQCFGKWYSAPSKEVGHIWSHNMRPSGQNTCLLPQSRFLTVLVLDNKMCADSGGGLKVPELPCLVYINYH